MSSVWYIGTSGVRAISSAAWASAGFPNCDDRVWSEGNGWSIPTTAFTQPQLDYLATQADFDTDGADGPRPGPGDPGWIEPDDNFATQAYVDSRVAAAFADVTDVVAEGVASGVEAGLADALVRDKNLSDVPSPADARVNLGFDSGDPDEWPAADPDINLVLLFNNAIA